MSGEGNPIDDLVPTEIAVTVRRDDRHLQPFDLEELKGERVEIYANGFTYRGVLQGADEREVYLKGQTRWWTIPLERIATLRPASAEAPVSEVEPEEEIAPGLRFDPPDEAGEEDEGEGPA